MTAAQEERLALHVEASLECDRRIHAASHPLSVGATEGTITLEGEVTDIASKRLAFARAVGLAGDRQVQDLVRVAAAEPMQDQALRDHVRDALVAEQSFDDCGIVLSCDGHQEVARTQPGPRMIRVRVQEGVVTLGGAVPSLCHRRLAEVVVWWIPGTRDVHNELSVSPPEADSDDEISDAVRLVLEKEPFLDAAQLGVQTRAGQVTLRGTLTSAEQRLIAERDAWYVPGVCEVIDRIAIVAA